MNSITNAIKNGLINRLNREVRDTKITLYMLRDYFTKSQIKKMALDRGFGAMMFAQELGVPFEDADAIYENFKKEIEELVDTY